MKLKELQSLLQDVTDFQKPKQKLEQYLTGPHLASVIVHEVSVGLGLLMADEQARLCMPSPLPGAAMPNGSLRPRLACRSLIATRTFPAALSSTSAAARYAGTPGSSGCRRATPHCTGTCMQGMLGIACSLKGCPHVLGIDIDDDALQQAAQNIDEFEELPMQLLAADVSAALPFHRLPIADIVISNPPFGSWRKGADTEFLAAAAKVRPRSDRPPPLPRITPALSTRL